jgi:hypothetical protein
VTKPTLIRIVAEDEEDDVEISSAMPSFGEITTRVHEVSSDVLHKNMQTLLTQVESLFANTALSTLSVKEVKVSVGVNGSGEFSLLGLTKAGAELKTTFEITFIPLQPR